jgi:hypothetical protein
MRLTVLYWLLCLGVGAFSCTSEQKEPIAIEISPPQDTADVLLDSVILIQKEPSDFWICDSTVMVGDYHKWMASLVSKLQLQYDHPIDEYIIVHANPWLIDSLRATDYYFLKEKGINNLDPKANILLKPGDSLLIPDAAFAAHIQDQLKSTFVDINIPEYTLRIVRGDTVIALFVVRVGRNDRRYLEMAKKVLDLRTLPGEGKIVRINRDPIFINPRDNKRYKVTRRDDNVVTALPNIPWLEPEINGMRYGQLIHPTTNLETLGKAYSNGCIGLREADAWSVYFYAPLGTTVKIRYDLETLDEDGDTIRFKNIYPGFEKYSTIRAAVDQKKSAISETLPPLCHCGDES